MKGVFASAGKGANTISSHPTLNDCAVYVKLDNDTADSVGSNDFTNNGATYVTGKLNEALDFDGINDWLDSNYQLGSAFTISFWAKVPATPGTGKSFCGVRNSTGQSGTRRFNFGNYSNPGDIYAIFYTSSNGDAGILNGPCTEGTVCHFILAVDGNDAELYIGGSSVDTDSTSGKYAPTQNVVFGKLGEQNIQYYDEWIDEIGIWDRKITGSEASDLYNGGAALPYN